MTKIIEETHKKQIKCMMKIIYNDLITGIIIEMIESIEWSETLR